MNAHPTQLLAASLLQNRCIVEMDTGEGKTLAVALAAARFAAENRSVCIATANEYLAQRDADWMHSMYADRGHTVAAVTSSTADSEKQVGYRAQVVYGTIRQFGFDFLKWRLHNRALGSGAVQERSANRRLLPSFDVLIVDEADSILIDEARTPLVIVGPDRSIESLEQTEARAALYRWAAAFCSTLDFQRDVIIDQATGAIAIGESGYAKVIESKMPREIHNSTTTQILHCVETTIRAMLSFTRDQHYVVDEGKIVLIDEYSGRKQVDRSLGGGLHEALQAREGLAIGGQSYPLARMTIQDFVSRFAHVCGITGTAMEDRREFENVYDLSIRRIEPLRPSQRSILPAVICRSEAEKFLAIASEVKQMTAQGRPVLVGTRTIEKSKRLSELFQKQGIAHEVLNANQAAYEAERIATAGRRGQVTVATNMAGRGTDIALGDGVEEEGGLHVIVSEIHSAERIDRQLIGRAGRQGDRGSARCYFSPDDELIRHAYGIDFAERLKQRVREKKTWTDREQQRIRATIVRAQRMISRSNQKWRQALTKAETEVGEDLKELGLDPHLDPLR
ncbi:preprotein translocase subunit SecA [Novipirellula aureliae]|uniref:Preprotein translocase subunit SecA n=1 Tax=Novipirellula aureliae TaxID=2527966 RepID=A0A5C6DY58_9BACT|nr:DEAD/DEAH box helicase [Novipirellula aureliae]TWU41548.1 preprotein translocase subunit SecA [Novipirellula aureliae]